MSAQFQVDTDRIAASSADIVSISGDIESLVQAMMTRLDGLQDAWRGTAATRFAQVSADWRATQQQVRTNLDAIGGLLGQAGTTYAETEAAATRMFG